jgi:hypothetical protein
MDALVQIHLFSEIQFNYIRNIAAISVNMTWSRAQEVQ